MCNTLNCSSRSGYNNVSLICLDLASCDYVIKEIKQSQAWSPLLWSFSKASSKVYKTKGQFLGWRRVRSMHE